MVSLSDVFENCRETAIGSAEPHGVKVISEINSNFPKVYASGIRLGQVINNLVSNSVRYTPEDGTIKISAVKQGDVVLVSVEDDGCGVSEENLPQIFHDFFRGDHDSEGTGLGLSICKRIVELHGGKIWVESPVPETGKGTRVSFTLPLKSEVK